MMFSGSQLPLNWKVARISEVAEVNPKLDKRSINDDLEVSFVSMPSVEAETGVIDVSNTRRFAEVKKGYTGFMEGDVLFAKITPCMENGKMALVPALKNNLGFGSTEFHVFRVGQNLEKKFLYYYVSSKQVRFDAEHNMTGAVGQKRVPTSYISDYQILVPPLEQQKLIVTKIEELFSELDSGIASLKTAQEQLKIYRQALLKHAFEGKLTEQWRKDNADQLETPEQLLARIQTERETRYQQQLNDWKQAVKDWEVKGKEGKKPSKPTKFKPTQNAEEQDFQIPTKWALAELSTLAYESVLGKMLDKQKNTGVDQDYLGNINVRWGYFDLNNLKQMKIEETEESRYSLNQGDLVVCEGGEPGRCAIWKGENGVIFIQKALHRIRFTESYLPTFAYYYLTYAVPLERVVKHFTGTTIKHLTGTGLGKVQFPICSLAEQQEIVSQLEEKLSIIEQNEKEIESALAKAELLRQSILKKVFSGQPLSSKQSL